MYIDLPNPRPMSNNVDINSVWYNESPTLMNNIGGVAEIRPIPSNITI